MKAGTPSATAQLVALNVLAIASAPETAHLVAPEVRELTRMLLRETGFSARTMAVLMGCGWFRSCYLAAERFAIPGLALHQALRKRRIEGHVRDALVATVRQVVVLGGGLDTLALRLSRTFADATFWELDHPASQVAKQRLLQQDHARWPNVRLVPFDFTRGGVDGALARAGARPDIPTVYVCEGVLMYLEEHDVARLLASLPRSRAGASRFIFTTFVVAKGRAPGFARASGMVGPWLQRQGEPFRWAIQAAELKPFLATCGWRLIEAAGCDALRRAYLDGVSLAGKRLAQGEEIVAAESQA